jgi:hypothetical protein
MAASGSGSGCGDAGGGSATVITGSRTASAAVSGTSHSQQSLQRQQRIQRWFEQVSFVQ